jgi:sporulation protein YlmC with PRC-barrel domain
MERSGSFHGRKHAGIQNLRYPHEKLFVWNNTNTGFVLGMSCSALHRSSIRREIMTLQRFVTMTAIAAALAIPAATGGFAQSATSPTPSAAPSTPAVTPAAPKAAAPAAAAPQAARHIGANEMRASKLTGSAVHDPADQKIGSIADLIVDRDGKVTDIVINVGSYLGNGDKHVAVKMTDLKRGKDNRFVLNTTKDALKQMAIYDLNFDAAAKSGSSTHK